MNPEIKEKWVAALRSGEYKQGKGSLRQGDEYCCLGVLCDVYRKEHHNRCVEWRDNPYSPGRKTFLCAAQYLPYEVSEWAELKGVSPVVGDRSLTSLNDSDGASFEEIADLIEEKL